MALKEKIKLLIIDFCQKSESYLRKNMISIKINNVKYYISYDYAAN